MTFMYVGKSMNLTGIRLTWSTIKGAQQLLRAFVHKGKGILMEIMASESVHIESKLEDEKVSELFRESSGVSMEPQGLPPTRTHDLHIVLKKDI